jgi:DNA-binding MarR family transcriptional regulator
LTQDGHRFYNPYAFHTYTYYIDRIGMMETQHDIPMGLREAYLSMHRQTSAHLKRCGLTADQFVLMILLSEEDGITQQELTRRAFSDPNTVRAMLVLLEGRGFVSRIKHPTDGRARKVRLTPQGRQILRRAITQTQPLRNRIETLFTIRERATLMRFLIRIPMCVNSGENSGNSIR